MGNVFLATFKCSGCYAEFSADMRGGLIERTATIDVETPSVGVCGEQFNKKVMR